MSLRRHMLVLALLLLQSSWSGGQWAGRGREEEGLGQGLGSLMRELRDGAQRDGGLGSMGNPPWPASREGSEESTGTLRNDSGQFSAWDLKGTGSGRGGMGRPSQGGVGGAERTVRHSAAALEVHPDAAGGGADDAKTAGVLIEEGLLWASAHLAGVDDTSDAVEKGRGAAARERSGEYGCLLTELSSVLRRMAEQAQSQRDSDARAAVHKAEHCRAERQEGAEALKALREAIARDDHSRRTWQRIGSSLRDEQQQEQQQQQQPLEAQLVQQQQQQQRRGGGGSAGSTVPPEGRSGRQPTPGGGGGGQQEASSSSYSPSAAAATATTARARATVSLGEAQHGRAESMVRKLSSSLREMKKQEERLEMSVRLAAVKCASMQVRGLAEGKQAAQERMSLRRAWSQLLALAQQQQEGGLPEQVVDGLGRIEAGKLPRCSDVDAALDTGEGGGKSFVNRLHKLFGWMQAVREALHASSQVLYTSALQTGAACGGLTTRTGDTMERVRGGEDAVELALGRAREQARLVGLLAEHQRSLDAAAEVARDALGRLEGSLLGLLTPEQAAGYTPALERMRRQLEEAEEARVRHRQEMMEGPVAELARLEGEAEGLRRGEAEARRDAQAEAEVAGQCRAASLAGRQGAGVVGQYIAQLEYALDYASEVWAELEEQKHGRG